MDGQRSEETCKSFEQNDKNLELMIRRNDEKPTKSWNQIKYFPCERLRSIWLNKRKQLEERISSNGWCELMSLSRLSIFFLENSTKKLQPDLKYSEKKTDNWDWNTRYKTHAHAHALVKNSPILPLRNTLWRRSRALTRAGPIAASPWEKQCHIDPSEPMKTYQFVR